MARPTIRNNRRDEKLLEALRAGNTHRVAAAYAGYSESTLYHYMSIDPDFHEKVALAECEAEALALSVVQQAASRGVWQAAAWFLERRRPKDYGKPPDIQREKQSEEDTLHDMSDEEFLSLLESGAASLRASIQAGTPRTLATRKSVEANGRPCKGIIGVDVDRI